MEYSLSTEPRAQRALTKLPLDVYERAKSAIHALASEPRPHGCCKLKGLPGWRIRIGVYRIRYLIDDTSQKITITHIEHRSGAY